MNILYLSHEGDSIGGSTESLINLIKSLKNNVNPIVIIPSKGKACDRLKILGIPHYIIPFKLSITDKKGLFRIITFIPRLIIDWCFNFIAMQRIIKLVGEKKIDIVHTNTAVIDFGDSLSKKIKAKHVWHLREFQNLDFGLNPLFGWESQIEQINKTDAAICISNSILKHYKMQINDKAVVIYDAVRSEKEIHKIQKKEDYILFAGNVIKGKGIEEAIKAFSIIHKTNKKVKFIVAGNVKNEYLIYLKTLTKKLEIEGSTDFIGFQKDVTTLMSKAICILMCSKNEGLGRVTIEAMFSGCPVVGFENAGTAEIINHKINGFLYKTEDELVWNMNYLIQNKNRVTPLLLEAQKFVKQKFSEEVYSKNMFNFYRSLLKQ